MKIKSLIDQLGVKITQWRLAFLLFIIVYTIALLLNLTNPPIQWDEVIHLNAGSFLYWGNYDEFVLNAFYPPLFDCITFISFKFFGVSLFAARLIPVVFSILTLWSVFEITHHMFGGREAFLSVVFLGVMPGFFWLSSIALLETALVFFTTVTFLFFYRWLTTRQDKMLVLSGLALGLGLLTKYQMIVSVIVMLLSIFFLARNQLKNSLKKLSFLLIISILVVLPWIVIAYDIYASQIFNQWLYALQVGNPERLIYSERFPAPIFYLIDMVWPYDILHPISLFIYVAGLAGLIYFIWRRRTEDKFIFIWFASIYIFFTLITNKEWRYVLPLFPTLSISAAVTMLTFYSKIKNRWTKAHTNRNKHQVAKVVTVFLVLLIAGMVAYSIYDTYDYISRNQITIDIQGATNYAFNNIDSNKSIMVLCPFNYFSKEMVRFYLWADGDNLIPVFQYPQLAVDSYTPTFNITEFIGECKLTKTQFVFTYEYGGTVPYYNTTLNLQQIYQQLYDSGNFTHISDEATFGSNPRRIFILEFIG